MLFRHFSALFKEFETFQLFPTMYIKYYCYEYRIPQP